jgi:AcrR family transcriptional regulator
MTTRRDEGHADESTRERILRHAIKRFSTQSYNTTGLREIAADAGVDVAWVHRSFGSKEKLFAECVRASIAEESAFRDFGPQTFQRLLDKFVSTSDEPEPRSIDILIHSMTSPEASGIIRELGDELVLAPLAKAAGPGREVKATVLLSAFFGIAIMRDIIGMKSLTDADPEEIRTLLAKFIEDAMGEP